MNIYYTKFINHNVTTAYCKYCTARELYRTVQYMYMDAKRTTRARALALALALASAEVRWIHSVSFPSARVYANARAYAYAYAFDNGIGIGIEVFSRVERILYAAAPRESFSPLPSLYSSIWREEVGWCIFCCTMYRYSTVQHCTRPVQYSSLHYCTVLYCICRSTSI